MHYIGNNIKKFRLLKGFTQEYMAEKLAISQSAYCKREGKQQKINMDEVDAIAKILGVKPADIIFFDEKKFIERQ